MTIVAIYGFTGRYWGVLEYDRDYPEVGATHRCMLFLSQETDSVEYESALAECRRYGFEAVANMRYGKLRVEVLNTDLYRGFSGFYEGALSEGSTLVFYPNEASGNGAAA
ncbi:hypothetical protein [Luteimonas deserti]|uniref:Uncharacterized protein n=1 Tax=Luteimonas deserti TaxID=2752306 RepID=A0A7Z0TZ13_9GAMM|nr:hypothetical protein [Luteimonas deserti]NYZ61748.1 hypothetical protein [Luteimonas deserti]